MKIDRDKPVLKHKWIWTTVVFLVALTGIRLTWMHFLHTFDVPQQPEAVQGVLDLRGSSLGSKQSLVLSGEWGFSPSLSDPSQPDLPKEATAREIYTKVPSIWTDRAAGELNASFHYGTYRLRILLDPDNHQTFGLRINEIKNASAVFVNGHYAGGSGHPAASPEQHQGRSVPYTVKLTPEDGVMDLTIHASSNGGTWGMTRTIRFGTMDAIQLRNSISIGLQLLLCVVFLFHSLYATLLYVLGARNRGLLYFSLLICCAIFSVLVADDKLLFAWLPFDGDLSIKILFLSYIGVAAFMPPLVKNLFPSYIKERIVHGFAFYCGLYAIFVLAAPTPYIMLSSKVLLTLVLLLSVAICAYILRQAMKEKEDVIFLMLACLSVGVNIVWAMQQYNTPLETLHYPFDLIIALLAFAAFWFRRFFRVTAQTRELAEKLQQQDKHKDRFLVNTSHELRNPLHGITNLTQTLLEDREHPLAQRHRDQLEILMNISSRMSLLLDDLLDVTRLKENLIRLNLKNTHMQSVAVGVRELFAFMLAGKPVRLVLDIPDHFPAVKADENRLVQILFNLLHNAVKYTHEGTITIRAEARNGLAYIHVEDTGIGIEEEAMLRIFDAYEQAGVEPDQANGGLGLGLNICRELVDMHGGALSVRSAPGQGSVFTFTLPLSEEDGAREDAAATMLTSEETLEMIASAAAPSLFVRTEARNPASPGKPKILAVDDDSINLNILMGILESEEYDITGVTCAQEAIVRLEHDQYDLVISDVMMPQVSGYELTRLIRERFSISELPVLLLTACSRVEDILTGFRAGANDYLRKPVDAWELKARVRTLTELKCSIDERLRMEGAWLQSQIQPHFLYNTLNSIAALGLIDMDKMQALLDEFSNYLRLSFDFQNSDPIVTLEHELSLVRSYVYIEKERFGDRLNIQWEVDVDTDVFLPPLTIQPLVENAVKHGILQRASGGTVCIRIERKDRAAEISIIDDGVGMGGEQMRRLLAADRASARTGVGLRNIDRRLKQFYGKGLHIQSTPQHGTAVRFQIPDKS